jgi:hypothetical protein
VLHSNLQVGKWPHCANLYSLLFDIEEQKENYEKAREVCSSFSLLLIESIDHLLLDLRETSRQFR